MQPRWENDEDRRRFLLADFVDHFLVSRLNETERREFERLLETEEYKDAKEIVRTQFEKGRELGRREMLLELIEERFGPLSATLREKLEVTAPDNLKVMARALLRARSIQEAGF